MEDDHVSIMLEHIQSDFRVFGEGLANTNRKLDIVIQDVGMLKEKVDKNTFMIGYLADGQKDMKREMNTRFDRIEDKLAVHDRKLARRVTPKV
ncbi:MAG: hypothetical protein WC838_06135 [Candidatus Margulisiibacteriota bacterium]|jgi:hypothetical protein